MPVQPRDASTVMLLRDAPGPGGGLEVLMVRRHAKSRFVPDAYVFPGGRIEERDYGSEATGYCHGLDCGRANDLIRDITPPEKALGAWVAGIRETFEEVGILLACDERGRLVETGAAEDSRMEARRRDLHADRVSLGEVLRSEGLRLAAGELHYFGHWITPETSPIRYDVRFFAAFAPMSQAAVHDGIELTEHCWVTPQAALRGYDEGRFPVILPTWATLAELAKFRSADEAIESTRGKQVPAILSVVVRRNGQNVEVMPDDVQADDERL